MRSWLSTWQAIQPITGWLSEDEAFLLHCLAARVGPDCDIVEIGSYHGKSTIALASGVQNPSSRVWAVDPHVGDITQVVDGQTIDSYPQFMNNIKASGFESVISPVRLASIEAARQYCGKAIQLLFVDGWHATDAVLEDYLSWRPFLTKDCTIVFDDWGQRDIAKALMCIQDHLPPVQGYVGKDLVYSHVSIALAS